MTPASPPEQVLSNIATRYSSMETKVNGIVAGLDSLIAKAVGTQPLTTQVDADKMTVSTVLTDFSTWLTAATTDMTSGDTILTAF